MKETPQWLKDLQESSWELELLISGGAIFTLIQAADFFTRQVESLKITNALIGTDMFLIMGAFGIQMLTMGFILHLVLRAFWVALVCANYVYPQGITRRRIAWKKPFRIPDPDGADLFELIVKVNRFCSAVMYLSVISCFLVAGLMLVSFVVVTLPALFGLLTWSGYGVYFTVFTYLLSFYLLDLLFFGVLRKIPGLAYVVYLPFRLFDLISLRFLYQRALWLYNTNVNRWKLLAGLSVFLVLAFFYSYGAIYRTLHWHNIFDQRDYRWQLAPGPDINQRLYRDEAGDDKVTFAQIPSKLIDNSYLEVFMVYRKRYDNFMPENGADTTFISDLAELSVNDSVYHNQLWHPTWRRENDQLGITAMVPIHHLKTGPHVLRLISKADTTQQLVIPFWKEEK